MGLLQDVDGREVDDRFLKAGGRGSESLVVPRWVGSSINHTMLVATATSDVVKLNLSVPVNTLIHAIMFNLVTKFDATVTLSDCTLIVGDGTDPNGILATAADLDDNGGTAGWARPDVTELGVYLYDSTKKSLTPYLYTAADELEATVTFTGDNVDDSTQGQVDVYLLMSQADQGYLVQAETN